MLKKFKTISGIHGLEEFDWRGDNLKQFSLMYGWNGTGKTTMSNILYCLSYKKMVLEDFALTTFIIETLPRGAISQNEITTHLLNVAVFNQEYIDKNVHFDNSGAEPIVMIGNKNIQLLEEIELEQTAWDKKNDSLGKLMDDYRGLPDCDLILSEAARLWRKVASELSASGDKYFGSGFSKTQVRELITKGDITHKNLDELIIKAEDESNRKQAIKKEWNRVEVGNFDELNLEDLYKESNTLLKTYVTVTKLPDIEALTDELQKWVEEGVSLHEGADNCAFCQKPLKPQRLNQLKEQFTDALSSANEEIDSLIEKIDGLDLNRVLDDSSELMPSLQDSFASHKITLGPPLKALTKSLAELKKDLENKKHHLTDPTKKYPLHSYPRQSLTLINKTEKKISILIEQHNQTVENADDERAKHLEVLMLNQVASHLKTHNYFSKLNDNKEKEDTISTLKKELAAEKTELDKKKANLNDQKIAVDKINGLLSNFFDNNKLCFKPVVVDGVTSYEIRRYGVKARKLSEGEKSVLALAHFLVSLKSHSSSAISKTVVVIDDPVDSQDGNFLFRTYGVIRRSLKDAMQIVMLTHNFEFFNIVRDWFTSVSEDPALLLISRESIDSNREKMLIENLPTLLRDYRTEYHYLFYKLFVYVHKNKDLDAPLVANISRKVLEYFSSFKWCCRNTEEFAARIQNRFMGDDATLPERAIGDAVYKFVNEYSHALDPFRPIAIAEQEAKSIATNTLNFIEAADMDHFNSLKRQCNREVEA